MDGGPGLDQIKGLLVVLRCARKQDSPVESTSWACCVYVSQWLRRRGQEKGPGSNGLALDAEGHLLVCDHGNRRVYRVEHDGSKTTLADRFEGKRFNSPNDLAVHSNGDIYFTDPPYGLTDESKRELDFCGVYRLKTDGTVDLITKELHRPNGIALSPDEKTLYVAQSHPPAPIYQAYAINENGTTDGKGKLLFDAKKLLDQGDPGLPDGMCVDVAGNLWATGPGGVLIISPAGKLLGRILMGKATANCTFGGDGSLLYITSSDRVCRIRTRTKDSDSSSRQLQVRLTAM